MENHFGHRWLRRMRRRCQNDGDVGDDDDNDEIPGNDNDNNNTEVVSSDVEVSGCE